jgi:hypothetical protein
MVDVSEHFNVVSYSDVVIELRCGVYEAGSKRLRVLEPLEPSSNKRLKNEGAANGRLAELRSEHEEAPCSSGNSSSSTVTLHVHRLMLSKSEYFQARMQRWSKQQEAVALTGVARMHGPGLPKRLVLVEHLEDEQERHIAELVIKSLYKVRGGNLSVCLHPDASPALLA